MKIVKQIKDSIFNPNYYGEVLKKPFSYSFKFLLVFGLLYAVVFTAVAAIYFVPFVKLVSERAPQLANYFPEELKVTIKNGVASTNVSEPYFIKIPEELKNNGAVNSPNTTINGNSSEELIKQLDNLVVINTRDKFDVNTFYSYKTFLLLTSDSVVYIKDGAITIAPLSEIKEFYLDRGVVSDFINKLTPFINFLYPIIFVGAYIVGYIVVMIKMVYLLVGALLVWLVAKIKGIKIGYKKSYQLGMHLIVPVMIVMIIVAFIEGIFARDLIFTFLFSILLIASAFLNLNKNIASSAT